ncbi:hypothetical protein ABG067_007606 [Albugo candida]
MLLMHTNHISRIQPHLEESIGNLQVLILTNNKIVNLTEIDSLIGFRKLDILSPLHSFIVYITIVLITKRKFYREYVIHKLPQLRVLDYAKIRPAERDAATRFFSSEIGQTFEKEMREEPGDTKSSKPEELTVLAANEPKRSVKLHANVSTTSTVTITTVETIQSTESMKMVDEANGTICDTKDVKMEQIDTSVSVTQTSQETEAVQRTPTRKTRNAKSRNDSNVEMMDASPSEMVYTPSKPIEMMTVPILRKELKKLNLPTTGLKAELVQRLREVLDRQN